MIAVQSGTLLRALGVQLKRRVSVRRGGDCNEVPHAIQFNAGNLTSRYYLDNGISLDQVTSYSYEY